MTHEQALAKRNGKEFMYVFLDLEWNVPLYRSDCKCFEILQIAAAKVEKLGDEPIETFNAYIKPQRYKINPRVKDLLPSLKKCEQEGKSFPTAYKEFQKWLGDKPFQYAVWGDYQDLLMLRRECQELKLPFKKAKFFNVQENYRKLMQDKTPTSLEAAVENLELSVDHGPFHDALSDVLYTVEIANQLAKVSFEIPRRGGFVRLQDVLNAQKLVRTDECRVGMPIVEIADILKINSFEDTRAQSRWVHKQGSSEAHCELCGRVIKKPYKTIRYCPLCGAQMFDNKTKKVIIFEKSEKKKGKGGK